MENIVKLKTNLIHLNYQTSKLGLAYLKHVENTYISLQLGKIIQHNECTVRASVVHPPDYMADWELWPLLLPVIRISYNISLAQEKVKIQNSKYGFY